MKGTLGLKKGSVPFKNDLECIRIHNISLPLTYDTTGIYYMF